MAKNKKKTIPQKKQLRSIYVSDLSRSMEERIKNFYENAYSNYCLERKNIHSWIQQFCLGLEFFHECVENLNPVLLGITPFSFRKIDKKAYIKNFTRKERYIANKALKLLEDAEIENKKEIKNLSQHQTILSRLLNSLWQAFKDCSAIISFACGTNGLNMLFEALKICRDINYNMAKTE